MSKDSDGKGNTLTKEQKEKIILERLGSVDKILCYNGLKKLDKKVEYCVSEIS